MEPPRPRFLFKMPRVVPNQKEKFETEDLMKRHSREGEVRIVFQVFSMLTATDDNYDKAKSIRIKCGKESELFEVYIDLVLFGIR